MAYTKQIWEDRIVEKPMTYTMTTNEDGTVTLTPVPGTITKEGSKVNAERLNHMEEGIYDAAISGGSDVVFIGDTEPTNEQTKLWVEDDMLDNIGSEIKSYTKDNIQVVKSDDGTMIMYFVINVSISDTSARQQGGLTYYSGYNEITLPEEFYYATFALVTTVLQANMNYYNKSYGAINNAKSIRISFTSTDANETRPISVVCIGRWKA